MTTSKASDLSSERRKAIEIAHAEMTRRGWGIASNGNGFGDPSATFTMVGPWKGDGYIQAYAIDRDCVEAVRKACEKADKLV